MKAFNTIVIVILSVAAVALFATAKGSRRAFVSSQAELLTTSNRLAEATAKLSESSAAAETLRVQINLCKGDLANLSNRLDAADANLRKASERINASERALQEQQARNSELLKTAETRQNEMRRLEDEIHWLQISLEDSRNEIAGVSKAAEQLGSQLNNSEAFYADLQRQWNDPSALRAQLMRLTRLRPAATDLTEQAKFGRLSLRADGTVAIVPVE